MPKSSLEKLIKANRWRIREGRLATDESYGYNGAFLVPLDGELFHVIISDGGGWRHLSASNAQKKILPSWSALTRLKDLFWADEDWVVLYIPAKDDYINDHPFTHHLWSPLNEPLPHPSVALV